MRTAATIILGLVLSAGPAGAYFSPLLPPGLELPPPVRSIIPPEVPTEGNPPSAFPPQEPPPPTVVIEPPGDNPPGAVPEPAAVVSAAAGLLAVAGVRWRRRRIS